MPHGMHPRQIFPLENGLTVASFEIHFRNSSGINVNESQLRGAASIVLSALGLHPRTEVSISCVTLAEMERLHIEHMDEPGATDVLSFPMDELRAPAPGEVAQRGNLGDIVLCPEFAAGQAQAAGHSLAQELDLLLTHGLLHLLGHDHAEPDEHAIMFGLQSRLLEQVAQARGGHSV